MKIPSTSQVLRSVNAPYRNRGKIKQDSSTATIIRCHLSVQLLLGGSLSLAEAAFTPFVPSSRIIIFVNRSEFIFRIQRFKKDLSEYGDRNRRTLGRVVYRVMTFLCNS
jgi:hypothetical protein